jgi:hypothetical protein
MPEFHLPANFPIHKIFERSCEMGLSRLTVDKVARIFGVRLTRRMRGKLYSLLDKLDHGHHVLRVYCKGLVGRMYEMFATFLRLETRKPAQTPGSQERAGQLGSGASAADFRY